MQKINRAEKQSVIEELERLRAGHINVSKRLIEKLKSAGYEFVCLGTGKQSKTSSMCIQVWELNNIYSTGVFVGIGTSAVKWGKTKYFAWCKEIV